MASRSLRGPAWALIVTVVALAGFSRTFYLRPVFVTAPTPPLATHVLLHAVVMTVWLALFVAQAVLGATHRVRLHRRLGWLGAACYASVLIVGALTTLRAGHGHVRSVEELAFVAFAGTDLLLFGGLTGAGLLLRRAPAAHRRLMMLGTIALLPPAVGRLPVDLVREGGDPLQLGLVIALAAGYVALDTARERRLHPAALWGLVAVAASAPLRLWLGTTATWQVVARFLVERWG